MTQIFAFTTSKPSDDVIEKTLEPVLMPSYLRLLCYIYLARTYNFNNAKKVVNEYLSEKITEEELSDTLIKAIETTYGIKIIRSNYNSILDTINNKFFSFMSMVSVSEDTVPHVKEAAIRIFNLENNRGGVEPYFKEIEAYANKELTISILNINCRIEEFFMDNNFRKIFVPTEITETINVSSTHHVKTVLIDLLNKALEENQTSVSMNMKFNLLRKDD
jgi:hypothetical protein